VYWYPLYSLTQHSGSTTTEAIRQIDSNQILRYDKDRVLIEGCTAGESLLSTIALLSLQGAVDVDLDRLTSGHGKVDDHRSFLHDFVDAVVDATASSSGGLQLRQLTRHV